MICAANSKQRPSGSARMWNKTSPGVARAWRVPAWISRNGCNSAGRGSPKSRSHAADPNDMTQERFWSASRNPTARNSAARSPHSDRTAATLSSPGLIVTTRKIAARVSGAATSCGFALEVPAAAGVFIGSNSVGWWVVYLGEACQIACSPDHDNLGDNRRARPNPFHRYSKAQHRPDRLHRQSYLIRHCRPQRGYHFPARPRRSAAWKRHRPLSNERLSAEDAEDCKMARHKRGVLY